MIDLKKLEKQLTSEEIIQLVLSLGADRYEEKHDCIIFPTICHNENSTEANMKLYYYKRNHKFHCYTDCGDNFNIYELFRRRYELLNVQYNFYTDIVLKIVGNSHQGLTLEKNIFNDTYSSIYNKFNKNQPKVELPNINPNILQTFTFYPTAEWLSDGISVESMKRFNILYSIRSNKIVIPHYDKDNILIGIRGRALEEEDLIFGKYMPLSIEGKFYAHPLSYNLYGYNLTRENILKRKTAIVVESEKAVLQYETMYGRGNNICVAVCGSILHWYQFNLLIKDGVERIIIAFDEPAQCDQKKEQYKKLHSLCKKYSPYCKMGFIFDTKKILLAKESPTDRGKETFEELLKNIIWI